MNASVIVYGPQGCGKTRHAEALRRHFGLTRVVEADDVPHGQPIPHNAALILTNDLDSVRRAGRLLRAVPFTAAAKLAGISA